MEVLTLERHYSQLSKSTPHSRRYSKGYSSIYLQRMRTPGTFASPGFECEHRCGERNAHQHPKYRPRSLLPICALAICEVATREAVDRILTRKFKEAKPSFYTCWTWVVNQQNPPSGSRRVAEFHISMLRAW